MIKLVRLDYRLLHGQVVFSWTGHVGGNTAALLKFCQAYPKIKEINYGAVANKPGSKAFDQSVFLTPEEQADTQKLLDMGIKIYSQQTPTFKVVPIDHT